MDPERQRLTPGHTYSGVAEINRHVFPQRSFFPLSCLTVTGNRSTG